jgi:DNA-binding NtrC family response regulator
VDFFCKRYGDNFSRCDVELSAEAMECLIGHDWPGNVRELENTIQRALTLCTDSLIRPQDLLIAEPPNPASSQPAPELGLSAGITMREMERQLIQKTLEGTRGNRTQAAKRLGISLRTLRNKLNEFGLQDRQAKSAYPQAQ